MHAALPSLPQDAVLADALATVFRNEVTVLQRQQNDHASTFPSEFVTCHLRGGQRLELFCKYAEDDIDTCFGHRGGTEYEAAIYRHLLGPLNIAAPRFYGTYPEAVAGRTWLVIERLMGAERVTEMADPAPAMREVARWLGQFHALGTAASPASDALIRHDAAYYEGWIRRTKDFAAPLRHRWLESLCRRREALIAPLLQAPRIFIHGEFYPHNLLFHDGAVYAIDWQSAALAAGELDLAALTERWPDQIVIECERVYQQSRWPSGRPASFAQLLLAARLHWLFRWLGDRPEWTLAHRSLWRFDRLRVLGQQMGLI